jgi:glycosyltransferase involved in cell wall biosynthesis
MDAVYLARDDALNPDVWSGSPHWIGRALQSAGFQLQYICPLKGAFVPYYKLKGAFVRRLGYGYTRDGEWPFLKAYAREAQGRLRDASGKIILSCGKPQLVFLKTNLPIIFFDDASMPAITNTHPGHTNFVPSINRRLHEAERRVLEKCNFACYASDWAAEGALKFYGAQFEKKIKVISFGANMEVSRQPRDIEQIVTARERGVCNLLFIGRYWESKGGPIALAVAEELHRRGTKVRLDVVGCTVPRAAPEYVRVHGFLSKKSPDTQPLLDRLFRESHFLIVPTRFEAYGLVFVEASSFGLPSLATATGGVTTIVHNGANGQLFSLNAPAREYADYIDRMMKDAPAYQALCRSSFSEYEQRLNWKTFGKTVRELIGSIF